MNSLIWPKSLTG